MKRLRAFLRFSLGGWVLLAATVVWCFAVYGGYQYSAPVEIQELGVLEWSCWLEPCRVVGVQRSDWLYRMVVTPGKEFEGHWGGVLSVAYSPDGDRIVSGGIDGTVRQWDAGAGALQGPPPGRS